MAKIRQQTFAVTATGVGRKDYSQQVEQSVEPIVRSYQGSYVLDEVYVVGAASTRTIDVAIPTDTVVLLYDFIASQTGAAAVVGLQVYALDAAGNASSIFSKFGIQNVEHHHSRGAPVFQQIRIVLTNPGALATLYVTIAGIVTGVEEYYQELSP